MSIKIDRCYLLYLFNINEDYKENYILIESYFNNNTKVDLHICHLCIVF
jgi:hypothetical protein